MAGRLDYRSLRQLAALLRKQSMVDASALLAFSLFHSVHNLRPWDGTTHIQCVSSLISLETPSGSHPEVCLLFSSKYSHVHNED